MVAAEAVEEEGHALLRAGGEVDGLPGVALGALRLLGAWQGGVRAQIRQDDRLLLVTVLDLIPAVMHGVPRTIGRSAISFPSLGGGDERQQDLHVYT